MLFENLWKRVGESVTTCRTISALVAGVVGVLASLLLALLVNGSVGGLRLWAFSIASAATWLAVGGVPYVLFMRYWGGGAGARRGRAEVERKVVSGRDGGTQLWFLWGSGAALYLGLASIAASGLNPEINRLFTFEMLTTVVFCFSVMLAAVRLLRGSTDELTMAAGIGKDVTGRVTRFCSKCEMTNEYSVWLVCDDCSVCSKGEKCTECREDDAVSADGSAGKTGKRRRAERWLLFWTMVFYSAVVVHAVWLNPVTTFEEMGWPVDFVVVSAAATAVLAGPLWPSVCILWCRHEV